jgi:hypothetical protein
MRGRFETKRIVRAMAGHDFSFWNEGMAKRRNTNEYRWIRNHTSIIACERPT